MMMLNYVHNGYLNKCDGVAENTLLPSGDHFNRETPPPPTLRNGIPVSIATSHAY
jgi:hypothetical protein